jgi:hypothetical protein
MRQSFLFAFALISFLSTAHAADWEGVFEGTIGKAKVIVELNAGEEKSGYKGGYIEGARYSYLPVPRDINLMLDEEGDTLRFTETLWPHRRFADEEDKKITGKWTLSVNGDTALGTWAAPDGSASTPIALTRVKLLSEIEVPKDANRLATTYDTLWLESVSFTDAGTAKSFGDVEVRFSKDSAFGITFPVLGQFPDGAAKAKANTLLLTQHLKSVVQYRNCLNGVPPGWETDEETTPQFNFEINYASPRLLSYTEYGTVFCGGAHTNNYLILHSFDLMEPARMGGIDQFDLAPEGFGRVLKLANKDERIAFERFAFGRWVEAAKAAGQSGSESCLQGWTMDAAEGEKDFDLSFTSKGLAVTRSDYPHVASVCLFQDFNPTIIPWADLKPFLKQGQTLLVNEIK